MPLEDLLKRVDIPSDAKETIKNELKKREERRKLLSRYENFLESAPDTFWLFDNNLKFLYFNESGLEFFINTLGFPKETRKEDFIGLHMSKYMPGIEKTERFQKYIQVLETGESQKLDVYQFKDRYASSRAFKVGDNLGIISRDITDLIFMQNRLKQIKDEEELYHTMVGHFVKNNLQNVIFNLDITKIEQENKLNFMNRIDRAKEICLNASNIIDVVNQIFIVLQSDFTQEEKKKFELINILDKKVQELLTKPNCRAEINHKSLNTYILIDEYFNYLLDEIFSFVVTNSECNLIISGNYDLLDENQFYCISIKETTSNPLLPETCERISARITDKWELLGHYIGLTLASVIARYYGGKLVINPSEKQGNEFKIYLPKELINEKIVSS